MKTKQSISKRFCVTGSGEITHRKTGQDHFNSQESGKTTRQKRRDVRLTKGLRKTIKQYMGK